LGGDEIDHVAASREISRASRAIDSSPRLG
jgi:hypothetical protein